VIVLSDFLILSFPSVQSFLLLKKYPLFCCILLALFLAGSHLYAQKIPKLGMVAELEHDSLLHATGFRLIGTTVGSTISPSLSDEEFAANLQKIKALKSRLYMCNVLFPGSLKIAGPAVDEVKVLNYLNAVLARAKKAGVKHLILGSGGARRLPDDYDKEKAKEEFAGLSRKMAIAAKQYGITIILEHLNSTETNFLNRLSDAADVVRRVAHPSFRLNADIYHMLKEEESPEEIRKAGDVIVYAEIAEKEGRTLPGVAGEDFRPYLKALRDIRFKGPILIEGRVNNLQDDVPRAYAYLTAQLKEAYQQKQ
jgi:sugar phosphate isomerase/epimerase